MLYMEIEISQSQPLQNNPCNKQTNSYFGRRNVYLKKKMSTAATLANFKKGIRKL